MPIVKKEVYASTKAMLEFEKKKIRSQLFSNRCAMHRLVAEQTRLKR